MVAAIARGVGVSPYGSGSDVLIPDWTTPVLWPYVNGNLAAPVVLASGTPGLSAITSDGASGVWTVGYTGPLWHRPVSGAITSQALPSGAVYIDCAVAAGSAFVAASSGAVLTSGGTALGAFPTYLCALGGSGSTLAAVLPASGLGTMTTGGATGLIAFPAGLAIPSCLSMISGSPVAVGGWQPAAALAAANVAMLSPVDATSVVAAASGSALVWRTAGALSDAWAQTQALTGLVNATAMAWTPDGFHVGTASPSSGVVQILSYAVGVLSLTQTVTVSGACGIVFGSDSLHALVAQSGLSQLTPLTFTSTWATGTAVTGVPGITTVTAWGVSGAVAAYSNGLAWLTLIGGTWAISSTTALGFTPTLLAVDPFLTTYAAASGRFSVVDPTGVFVGSGSFSGVPGGLVEHQGRVVLSVPATNALYLYGQSAPGAWTQQASGALTLGTRIGLAMSETELFAMGSGSTATYGFSGTPFTLTSIVSGVVAQRAAGAWTVTPLGLGHTPSAVGYDASGNLRVVTTQNNQWKIAASGTVLSSGIVAQQFGQAQSVPLGLSAMLAIGSGMICATSIQGTVVNTT